MTRRLALLAVLAACYAVLGPTVAEAGNATGGLGQTRAPTKLLAVRAAERMARACSWRLCLDANEYSIDNCTRVDRQRARCDYHLYGYYFSGGDPVGDFDCVRTAQISSGRAGLRGRSIGVTSCQDDASKHTPVPWPKSSCTFHPLPEGGGYVLCIDVVPPPHPTLHQPLWQRHRAIAR